MTIIVVARKRGKSFEKLSES